MTSLVTSSSPVYYTAQPAVNSDTTITGIGGRMVMFSGLTAPRNVYLPPSTTMMQTIMVMDEDGSCGLTNYISIVCSGTDKIEGNPTRILNYPYAALTLEASGNGGWIVSAGVKDHNALLNLQGGTGGQYYHLTSAEYTGTGTGPFVRQTSPALLGIPTAPTPATADNSTTVATTAYVQSQGYATGAIWGVQKAVVDITENMLVPVNYQHHILRTFIVYGTMIVNGESYVFNGVS